MNGTPWYEAPLVSLDLEGSGAQDRDREAILEIATVPIINARPDPDDAYCTLVNPGRPIPARPWISPGLTNHTLRTAPTLDTIEPILAERLTGRYLVGHNISSLGLVATVDVTLWLFLQVGRAYFPAGVCDRCRAPVVIAELFGLHRDMACAWSAYA